MTAKEMQLRQLLDEMNGAIDQVKKFNEILDNIKNGKPIDEVNFDRIYVQHESTEINDIVMLVAKTIESLFKVIYCILDKERLEFERDIMRYRNKVKMLLQWGPDGSQEAGYHRKEDLQYPYMEAVALYVDFAKPYPHRQFSIKVLPEKCPWNLNEIVEADIQELKQMLIDIGDK